jgi:DNA (cytosine-5)-methyltransferase 1
MGKMVLSLFPGIGLLDRAFEEQGFQIVRGPDLIWGGDIHTFHVEPYLFHGVIGGSPCQKFSTANEVGPGSQATDLIGEFVRIVDEAQPDFVVMENVPRAIESEFIPDDWHSVILSDWDCGGLTGRKRRFWTFPFTVVPPVKRPITDDSRPALSVMSTTYKRGKSDNPFVKAKHYLPGDLPIERYGELQGFEAVARGLDKYGFSRRTIIQLLGNGVPHALGSYVAQRAWQFSEEIDQIGPAVRMVG